VIETRNTVKSMFLLLRYDRTSQSTLVTDCTFSSNLNAGIEPSLVSERGKRRQKVRECT